MAEEAKWYVVHTYSGYENKVAENIKTAVENRKMDDQIFDVFYPMEEVEQVRNDKMEVVKRKSIPGYVFVKVACTYRRRSEFEDEELAMTDEAWYLIRNTRGVTGFVGPESKPVPLTEEEVKALGVEKRVVEVNYEVGDMVQIIDGPFEGVMGVVNSIDTENNSVNVTISMLGRETPVDLELDQVEANKD